MSSGDPLTVLQERFGYDTFMPGQRDVIDHLLAGRSAAAVFPTGGGKSLCYQLPALMLDGGVTLVVSPLIALMKDQVDALTRRGIAAERLDSTLDLDGYRDAIRRVRNGELRLLYVAPERFNNERFRELVRSVDVSLFAVDEAHCISEWGHAFRPDYLKLAGYAKECNAGRVLALTATATPQVLADICEGFGIQPDAAVTTGFYRPNLTMLMTPMEERDRDAALLSRLKDRDPGPTIVYVTLQRTANMVASMLSRRGLPARAYHAGMKSEDRHEVQEWFLRSESDGGEAAPIVVATIAFGMGIDKSDIRHVLHYNLPKSLENHAQEIGRAGRDGEPSTCEVLACGEDLAALENFAYGDTPTLAAVRSLVAEVLGGDEDFDVSLYDLSGSHDIRPLVVRTLLTYLELEGWIEGGTPFYDTYKFKPLMPSKAILAKFDGNRRAFLAAVFRHARRGRTWLTLDAADAATQLGVVRDRVIRALDYLHEKGMLEVEAQGVRHRFHRLRTPSPQGDQSVDALAADLHARCEAREARELERVRQVVALTQLDGCQVNALCSHFGEERAEPCGHCSWCLRGGGEPDASLAPRLASLSVGVKKGAGDQKVWEKVPAVRAEHRGVLDEPRAVAKFLCGLGSPALSKAKLTRHDLYGTLDGVPFGQVLERARALNCDARVWPGPPGRVLLCPPPADPALRPGLNV